MVRRGNRREVRGKSQDGAGRESTERIPVSSLPQAIMPSFSDGTYTLDSTYHTIVVHPGTCRQTQDDHLDTCLRLLLDSTDEGIYWLDLDGCCTFSNRAGAQLLGYQPEDILGQQMHRLIHHSFSDGSPYPQAACPIFRSLHDGHGIRKDVEVLWRRDGTAISIEYSAYPIIEAGQIVGTAVIFRDIRKRKRAQAALAASETRKVAILEAALNAMITVDHEDHILEFNPTAERIFGYQRGAVLGQELADLIIPPLLHDQYHQGLAACLADRNGRLFSEHFEITAVRADGNEFPVEFSMIQISHAGPPLFTSFIRDLSERKRVEQARAEQREHVAQQFHDGLEQILGTRGTPAQLPESVLHTSSASEHLPPNVALTKREREVLMWMGQDVDSNHDLAHRLNVSESTIHFHVGNIFKKLQLQKRSQVVAYAIRHGLAMPLDRSV